MYANKLHYLKTSRNDTEYSFGIYIDMFEHPIAWATFSPINRKYKSELLHYLQIESHNTLEMTRAWCYQFSPRNTMSVLFSYSMNELKKIWYRGFKEWRRDKPLQCIYTTINPNLGFKGTSFIASNFIPIALRPASFLFEKNRFNSYKITTRRNAADINLCVCSKISQLPLVDMVMLYNKKDNDKISKGSIYHINPNLYNTL